MPDHARMPMTALVRGGGRLSAPAGAERGGSADQVVAKPFVKWAGGKRSLVSEISKHLPPAFDDYYEPFVGGGALFFHLNDRIGRQRIFLSDINRELITTYQSVRYKSRKLVSKLQWFEAEHRKRGKKFYYDVRDSSHKYIKNMDKKEENLFFSGRFIYLNKTCFNGLHRVNRAGDFNVPMGNYKNPNICDDENILAVSKVLKRSNVSIKCHSFEKIKPMPGDLVYCDPPYHETFSSYTDGGFGKKDQKLLRDKCLEWRRDRAYVAVSNSDTPHVRELYDGFNIVELEATRHINCDGGGRGKVQELLITG